MRHRQRRGRRLRTSWLYFIALVREFRWTLLGLCAFVVIGAILYRITPHEALHGNRPNLMIALYGAWMALLAQPIFSPPETWYLEVMCAVYPLAGFILIGEGVVRLALLAVSRREGEKEWMRVMASTFRDHVVLCGLGHLGVRVLDHLISAGVDVVVLEKDEASRFIAHARELDVPILIRDMKEDQSLIDAGVPHARAVIIATNDDMANIEVALDSRRLNPNVRVVMRLFDQQIASKIAGAIHIDAAFSSSSLAAPMVAAMSLDTKILSTTVIAGVPHVTSEITVSPGSPFAGKTVVEIETGFEMKILARVCTNQIQSLPGPRDLLNPGDTIVFHTKASQLATIVAEGKIVEGGELTRVAGP
jgi:voltage-gated potassium channel